MQSVEYRKIIRNIIKNVMFKKFPGLKRIQVEELVKEAAKAIHARMYGANVDGVESPIWREDKRWAEEFKNSQPNETAQEILNE